MKILVTNDDGYTAPGLQVLALRLLRAGHDVTVAAPLRQQSGGSASLGRVVDGASVPYQELYPDTLSGIRVIAIDAPPALAVKAILGDAFGEKPDVVLSGINGGWNTGGATLHSGTLGAAMTACSLGYRAAAISCGRQGNMQTAADVAVSIAQLLNTWTSPVVLNVNVPNLPLDQVKGVRRTQIGRQGLIDVEVARSGDELLLKLVPKTPEGNPEHDSPTVLDGYVSVSVLTGRFDHLQGNPHDSSAALESRVMAGLQAQL